MNIITKLNIRQRVMLILTILASAFLAWQIYNFVHGNTAPSRPMAAVSMPVSAGKVAPLPAAGNNNPGLAPVAQPLPANLASPALSSHQQEYLNLVREYQLTKMKRQILEEEAGLANAQKRIADAGKGGALAGMDNFVGDNGSPSNGYQLAYLDRQAGEWTATISQAGQYTEVHVGTRLADGAKVISISDRGVVLRPAGDGKNLTLGFQGSVNVDNSSPAYTVPARPVAKKDVKMLINNNPSNARIAKILGITGTIAVPKDIPAAPLTVTTPPSTPAPVAQPSQPPQSQPAPGSNLGQPASPSPSPAQAQTQTDSQAMPDQSATPPAQAPVVKPVSVKELREYKSGQPANIPPPVALNVDAAPANNEDQPAVDQTSWQQSADLQGSN